MLMSEIVLEIIHIVAEAHDVHGLDPEPHGDGGDLPHVHPLDELLLHTKFGCYISNSLDVHREQTDGLVAL